MDSILYIALLVCIVIGMLASIISQITDMRKTLHKIVKHLGIEEQEKNDEPER